jgi:hypothetical protein
LFSSCFLHLVDVDFQESHVGELLAQILDKGSDGLAWAAPGGVEVDDDAGFLGEGFVEFGLAAGG